MPKKIVPLETKKIIKDVTLSKYDKMSQTELKYLLEYEDLTIKEISYIRKLII